MTIVTLSCSKSQKHRSKLRDLIDDVGNSTNPSGEEWNARQSIPQLSVA